MDQQSEPGEKSEKAERLVDYCLGAFADKDVLPCSEVDTYLAKDHILLFKAQNGSAVLRNTRGCAVLERKQIVEALISQRAMIPEDLCCWLICDDSAGSISAADQGLHVAGMRRREKDFVVLVPTSNRQRFLGPRLAQQMEEMQVDWTPWHEKTDTAWWGGALTGDRWKYYEPWTLTRREVLRHFNFAPSDRVHLHLVKAPNARNPVPPGVPLRGQFAKRDAFTHKCLILLPGNDIASGSSWTFAGNSVVMMPPPHMDHILHFELKPWEHYVPLDDEPQDVLAKLDWVLNNEREARQIVERSHERLRWLCGEEYLWACNEVLRRITPRKTWV